MRRPRKAADTLPLAAKQEIGADYASGLSSDEIARRRGFSPYFIRKCLRTVGTPIRPLKRPGVAFYSGAYDEEVVAAYGRRQRVHDIAARFGVDIFSVYKALRRNGVTIRPQSEAQRRYPLNESAFDVVTEESAYWVGFLMADGCVAACGGGGKSKSVILGLADKDFDHLLRFRAFLGAGHPVKRKKQGANSFAPGAGCCEFRVVSRRLFEALGRYGVVPRKSRTAEVIGLEGDRHFWRGVVDGDGYLFVDGRGRECLGLVGSAELIAQFHAFVRSAAPGAQARPRRMHGIWQLRLNCRHARKLASVLYRDAQVSLPRKQKVADQFIRAHCFPNATK